MLSWFKYRRIVLKTPHSNLTGIEYEIGYGLDLGAVSIMNRRAEARSLLRSKALLSGCLR
jgi:hypothetical protein